MPETNGQGGIMTIQFETSVQSICIPNDTAQMSIHPWTGQLFSVRVSILLVVVEKISDEDFEISIINSHTISGSVVFGQLAAQMFPITHY